MNARGCQRLLLVVVLLTLSPVSAQTTQPAGRFDDIPIRRDAPTTRATASDRDATASAAPAIGLDLGRLAMSLAIVLGLIVVCAWVYRRLSGQASVPAATSVVRVLGRTALAPKQQILLIQVGRRVIVVGESNGQFAPLSEITDEDEIASLQGEDRPPEQRGLFGRLLRREHDELTLPTDTTELPDAGTIDGGDAPPDAMRSEIGSLLQRVRTLSSQFKK